MNRDLTEEIFNLKDQLPSQDRLDKLGSYRRISESLRNSFELCPDDYRIFLRKEQIVEMHSLFIESFDYLTLALSYASLLECSCDLKEKADE